MQITKTMKLICVWKSNLCKIWWFHTLKHSSMYLKPTRISVKYAESFLLATKIEWFCHWFHHAQNHENWSLKQGLPKCCIYLQATNTKSHMSLNCTLVYRSQLVTGPQAPKQPEKQPRICWVQWLEKKNSQRSPTKWWCFPNWKSLITDTSKERKSMHHIWTLNSKKGWLASEQLQTESFRIPRLQQSYNASTFVVTVFFLDVTEVAAWVASSHHETILQRSLCCFGCGPR